MWLLCAGKRYPELPIEGWIARTKEMRNMPRRTRSVEPPVPDQEVRDSQSEDHVAEAAGQNAQLEIPTATARRSRPSQTAATMQTVQLTRNRSQTGRGQKRTNAGAIVDPAEQKNQPTQRSGSQRPQRQIVPSRRAMEANGGNARHTQHSHHMEIDFDNDIWIETPHLAYYSTTYINQGTW